MVDLKAQCGKLTIRLLLPALLCTLGLFQWNSLAQSPVPSNLAEVSDDFETGNLETWQQVGGGNLGLISGTGHDGSTALSVILGSNPSYLYQSDLTPIDEAYLTFWFNPNGASLPEEGIFWIPSKSIRIADIKGPASWHVMAGLRLRKPEGLPYRAYMEWQAPDGTHYDYASGEFNLVNGWQKITLGFHTDEWIAVWLNDILVRRINAIDHSEDAGAIFEIGRSTTSTMTTSGSVRYDDVTFAVPVKGDLWVDAAIGHDNNDGLTTSTAFRTIQKAAELAGPGTVVHVQPGVYRETVRPARDGGEGEPVVYVAEDGPGTAIIRGSEPSSSLVWTRLSANTIGLPPGINPADIYYADLSSWNLTRPPRFLVLLGADSEVKARLPLAREPDWEVVSEWKHHEFWWAADGGSDVAGCDPSTNADPNCDLPWRSLTQLTDRNDDSQPAGIEPGNLTTLGNLTGGTLVAMDSKQGHYVYRRNIVAHNVSAGRISVGNQCAYDGDSSIPGLGWGSKYYVEGLPSLLDTQGEWWYDSNSKRLYLWPPSPGTPASQNLEISRRYSGFNLSHRSHITLNGLSLEFFEHTAIYQSNWQEARSYDNAVRNATVLYANRGLYLGQEAGPETANITDGFVLEDSTFGYMDSEAILLDHYWEGSKDPALFHHAGIVNTVIRNNEFHHLGFRSDFDHPVGAMFTHADRLRFEGNHVHHVAHNGIQFSRSIIQSPNTYAFDPNEIKTGKILIKDNLFEKACQLGTDCGALKIWGDPPDGHVFRELLITGNVFRDTYGWSFVSAQRGRWSGGPGSEVVGMGGKGLFVDMASGIHAFRNIAYNNAHDGIVASGDWRDGNMIFYNNSVANGLYGFRLIGPEFDTHGGSINTQLVNNAIVNNEAYGILLYENDGAYGNLSIDHNLYFNNGWRAQNQGGMREPGAMAIWFDYAANQYYETISEIQTSTPWEDHGQAGDPRFQAYDASDHNMHDGSWPGLRLTAQSSNAINRGTTNLPQSLTELLNLFGVQDQITGPAFDIGRYEYEESFVKTAGTLLVADHNPGSSNPQANYFIQTLGELSWAHDLWDTGVRGAPSSSILDQYSDGVVIWSVPEQTGHLANPSVQADLQAFLDGGGSLLISGQNVAKITNGSAFLREYLHASFVQDSSGVTNLAGVAKDPIGDGLTLSLDGSGGAANQSSPDVIEISGPVWPAFSYGEGTPAGTAGARINTGVFRVVFMAFGFEGIDSATDRASVMQRALYWLAGSSTTAHIDLSSGWNLASLPVEPLMPSVDGALSTLDGRYCHVIGEDGAYSCELAPTYRTLSKLHAGQAYFLHIGGNGGARLWLEGSLVPPTTPIPLDRLWNWVGYLPANPLPVATALQSLEGKYLMIHSIDKTYNPSEPLYSTLTHLEPGQGYLIYATTAADLLYPAGASAVQATPQEASQGACKEVSPTPFFAVMHGEITINGSPAPKGTIVKVFDPSGALAGCTVVQHPGHYGYVHVYGQVDEDSHAPGLREGEQMSIRVNSIAVHSQSQVTWNSNPAPFRVDLNADSDPSSVNNPAYLPMVFSSP